MSATTPPPPAVPSRPLLPPGAAGSDDLSPTERRLMVAGVTGAHLLALWGLLQIGAVQDAVRQVAPLMVDFISIERPKPPPPAPPPPPRPQPVKRQEVPPPILSAPPTPEPLAPATFVVPPPPPEPMPVAVLAPPAPPAPPPAPPQPRVVPASSVAYLEPPPIEVPMVSRRLGEQGTVQLRVLVGPDGLPRQVTVQRSSGFARLDDQAVWAMKRARFKPQMENGVAIEWVVIAPLQYELR